MAKLLGKCAAASLDVLSSIFGDSILDILLPYLNEALSHSDWLVSVVFLLHHYGMPFLMPTIFHSLCLGSRIGNSGTWRHSRRLSEGNRTTFETTRPLSCWKIKSG